MKCPNCGTEYAGNFCPSCGSPAPQDNSSQNGYQQTGQAPYQNGFPPTGQAPYQNGAYGQPSYGMPNPNIPKRSVATCIIFTILTCGIYGIYWFIKLTDETNMLVNDQGVSNGENLTSGGIAFLFSLITCGIYSFYWAYKQGEHLDRVKRARGINQSSLATTYLVIDIALTLFTGFGSIIVYALMQSELNTMNN